MDLDVDSMVKTYISSDGKCVTLIGVEEHSSASTEVKIEYVITGHTETVPMPDFIRRFRSYD